MPHLFCQYRATDFNDSNIDSGVKRKPGGGGGGGLIFVKDVFFYVAGVVTLAYAVVVGARGNIKTKWVFLSSATINVNTVRKSVYRIWNCLKKCRNSPLRLVEQL